MFVYESSSNAYSDKFRFFRHVKSPILPQERTAQKFNFIAKKSCLENFFLQNVDNHLKMNHGWKLQYCISFTI